MTDRISAAATLELIDKAHIATCKARTAAMEMFQSLKNAGIPQDDAEIQAYTFYLDIKKTIARCVFEAEEVLSRMGYAVETRHDDHA